MKIENFLLIFFRDEFFLRLRKLNFLIKIPVPTATAAAGVASFKIHPSISSKPDCNLDTIFGSAANVEVGANKINRMVNRIHKYKNVLSESDKNIIKAIIEERKRQIDKELGEDN